MLVVNQWEIERLLDSGGSVQAACMTRLDLVCCMLLHVFFWSPNRCHEARTMTSPAPALETKDPPTPQLPDSHWWCQVWCRVLRNRAGSSSKQNADHKHTSKENKETSGQTNKETSNSSTQNTETSGRQGSSASGGAKGGSATQSLRVVEE